MCCNVIIITEAEKFRLTYGSVTRHVLGLFPEMAQKRHKASGKLLLHHAVYRAKATAVTIASSSVASSQSSSSSGGAGVGGPLAAVVAVYPQAVRIGDSQGALPLHWAARNPEVPLEVPLLLLLLLLFSFYTLNILFVRVTFSNTLNTIVYSQI